MEIVRASVKFGQARQSGADERRKCGREKKKLKRSREKSDRDGDGDGGSARG